MSEQRPRVRIRFQFNMETGEIEEFLIDDNAPAASEGYHDAVARTIAGHLGRGPQIADAGLLRGRQAEPGGIEHVPEEQQSEGQRDAEQDETS